MFFILNVWQSPCLLSLRPVWGGCDAGVFFLDVVSLWSAMTKKRVQIWCLQYKKLPLQRFFRILYSVYGGLVG